MSSVIRLDDPHLPIVISRDDARHAAADELAKPVYIHARPTVFHRGLTWLGDEINKLFSKLFGGSGAGGGGNGGVQWWAWLALIAIVVGVLLVIRWKFGPVRRSAKAEKLLFDEAAPMDAAGYRKAAESFGARGEWAEAVRARLRAIIASLEERTLLEPRPGRTADVAAREAGRLLPEQAGSLLDAARTFDDIWYGEAVASSEDYRRLVVIDDAVGATRPRLMSTSAATGDSASPYASVSGSPSSSTSPDGDDRDSRSASGI